MSKQNPFVNRIIGYGTKPADQFTPNALNYRTHPQRQRDAVQASLRELGWIGVVVENVTTGNLIDGHERVWQALPNNEEVPYIQVALSEAEEKLALAVFDPIGAMAETDSAVLDELLRDVNTGEAALQELIAGLAAEAGLYGDEAKEATDPGAQVDKAEELRQKWGVESGQLWQLGEHRLICGDCTDAAVVARLMDGEKAQMMFTDPPYGVDYTGGHFHSGDVNIKREREKLANDGNADIYGKFLPVVLPFVDGPCYTWFASSVGKPVFDAIIGNHCEIHAMIIWHKVNAKYAAMNAQYKQRHEPLLYFKPKGSTLRWVGPTDECTIWEIKRDGRNDYHPTQKPVELAARAIGNHKADIVADFFLGSGSTLMACEQLGRKCRAAEISPGYVAVALDRWSTATGKTPVLIA